jgi:phytoene/squalene synthetase
VTIADCARLLAEGDPDRFRAVMSTRPELRGPLFVLYAANLEIARAPFAAREPLIAEMRLHWWRDLVERCGQGPAPAHEVAGPLHDLMAAGRMDPALLLALIDARRWDCWAEPHADAAALQVYLDATGGGLMVLAGQAVGVAPDHAQPLRVIGRAGALASYLVAVASLLALGRSPLPAGDPAGWAREALAALHAARRQVPAHSTAAVVARSAWLAPAILRRIGGGAAPTAGDGLRSSPVTGRLTLIWRTLSGLP